MIKDLLPSRKRIKGFTLIELLIVITIIGILAVALIPRITQGPARARDVKRKADLQNISAALELYFSDHGNYPFVSAAPESDCLGDSSGIDDMLAPYLEGGSIPTDPGGGDALGCGENYLYRVMTATDTVTTASSYALVTDVEVDSTQTEGHYCDITSSVSWNNLEDTKDELESNPCTSTSANAFYVILQ